jgi:hypothetical protein
MPTYEPDDVICLDGWCKADRIVKQEGITTWTVPKQKKTRQCCSTCPDGETCPDRCKMYKQPCDSMEEYKNTEHQDGNYWRKDNIKSKYHIPDDGTRWWIISEEYALGTKFYRATEEFHSEKDALKWMKTYSKNTKTWLIKGKFVDIKENTT